jgi:hypothetical protein
LFAGSQVNDAEPRMTQSYTFVVGKTKTLRVGTTMLKRMSCPLQGG